ncbi:MAG: hypothetical protein ACRDTG_24130 [Pseudonocardiaceae bacterium]
MSGYVADALRHYGRSTTLRELLDQWWRTTRQVRRLMQSAFYEHDDFTVFAQPPEST